MGQNGSKIDVQGTFGASSAASWWLLGHQWRLGVLFGGLEESRGGLEAFFCCLGVFVWALFGKLLVALSLILGTLWRHFGDYWPLSMQFWASCLKTADLLQTQVFLV